MIFLSSEILTFLLVELVVLVLCAISQFNVIKILRFWDFTATSSAQYELEKKNYLVNTILSFSIACKIILFVFFALSLNELATIVPGAMCGAGVIGSNEYGNILLLLKLLLIFGLGFWLIINKIDLRATNFPLLKKKYLIFSFLFILILIEFALEIAFFTNIPLKVPVFCCSVVFQAPKLPFGYTKPVLVALFYAVFCAIIIVNSLKQSAASFALNLLYLFVAYYAITYFFGLYVYEQPNHKCPYCMLSKDYFYVGYLIWGSLFLGIFLGITPFLVELVTKKKYVNSLNLSSFWLSVNSVVCSFYVLKYYLSVGVWL